jgi:hypothetical protein
VHVNGVKLIEGDDYTVNTSTSTLTLVDPVAPGGVVQWDLLIPASMLAPGAVNAYKILPMVPNGTLTAFHLSYTDPSSGNPTDASVGTGAQLWVSVDGVVQEPGVDFVATGATLTMSTPPPADSHFWAVWYKPGAP